MRYLSKGFLSLFVSCCMAFTSTSQIIQVNGLEFWTESFGHRENPAVLLIMGAFCQGIMWPESFCQELANQGYYVIRYDHRDTGYSSSIDYSTSPYTIEDLAEDALGLLEALEIKKVDLLGLSMGSVIAEIMSVKDPNRINTITLIASSPDFTPMNRAFTNQARVDEALSRPTAAYTAWMDRFLKNPPTTFEEILLQRMNCWRLLHGDVFPFEEKSYEELHRLFLKRALHPESINNHMLALLASEKIIRTIPSQVRVPTLIIHGTEDVIFPKDHGIMLSKAIAHARFFLIEGMGHIPNQTVYKTYIEEFKKMTKEVNLKQVQVGVAVLVSQGDKILLGKRKGSHGANLWAPPGGHLEFGETVFDCAIRELLEETGLRAIQLQKSSWVENIIENKHYITVFVLVDQFEGDVQLLEPNKCFGWDWFSISDLPLELFDSLKSYIHSGSNLIDQK